MSNVLVPDLDVTERDILIIDDDVRLLAIMVPGLQSYGLRVKGTSNSIEALMMASDTEPTCVVLDLKMPGVNGLDLVTAICGLKRHAVILLSGYMDVPTTVHAMKAGVVDVLQKPVSQEGLYDAVRRAQKSLSTTPGSDDLTFTRRERQVAELVVQGMTAKQIGMALELSPRTVEFFRASLMRKTHSPNQAALASALTRIGFS